MYWLTCLIVLLVLFVCWLLGLFVCWLFCLFWIFILLVCRPITWVFGLVCWLFVRCLFVGVAFWVWCGCCFFVCLVDLVTFVLVICLNCWIVCFMIILVGWWYLVCLGFVYLVCFGVYFSLNFVEMRLLVMVWMVIVDRRLCLIVF